MRALTERQRNALVFVSIGFVNQYIKGTMASLIRRGLVVAEKRSGRLTGFYHLTDEGRKLLAEPEA